MKTILKHTYYCDFCRKYGSLGPSMRNHEKICFMNPSRICETCDDPAQIEDLIKALSEDQKSHDERTKGLSVWDQAELLQFEEIPKLRQAASECPACINSAIRQSKTYVHNFDYLLQNREFVNRGLRSI